MAAGIGGGGGAFGACSALSSATVIADGASERFATNVPTEPTTTRPATPATATTQRLHQRGGVAGPDCVLRAACCA